MKPVIFISFFLIFTVGTEAFSQTLTGEPMVFNAYKDIYHRQPNALEINIKNYNGGSWYSYDELKKYIREFQSSLVRLSLTISSVHLNEIAVIGIRQNGQQVAVAAVSLNGGKILAHDGASIINGSAGNIVRAGGGNLTGNDGSGITISQKMAGIAYATPGFIPSANTLAVTSGKGALVINKSYK